MTCKKKQATGCRIATALQRNCFRGVSHWHLAAQNYDWWDEQRPIGVLPNPPPPPRRLFIQVA